MQPSCVQMSLPLTQPSILTSDSSCFVAVVRSSMSESFPGAHQSDASNLFCSDLVPVCAAHQQTLWAFRKQTSELISTPISGALASGKAGARAPWRWRAAELVGLPRLVDAKPGQDRCCYCCLSSFKLLNILTLSLPPSFSTLAHIVFVVFWFDQWLLKSGFLVVFSQ